VALILQREDDNAVLMGMHRHGEFSGQWGLPSAVLREGQRPQILACKLASAASCGVLGNAESVRTAWNTARAGASQKVGDTLVYTIRGLPVSTADTIGGVIDHCANCFAQDFDHGVQELLQCPVGLLPFRRVQWREWSSAMEHRDRWDPITLEVMRRRCARPALAPQVTSPNV